MTAAPPWRRVCAQVLTRHRGAILLLRPLDSPYWVLPGGNTRPQERPDAAAARGMEDLTGLQWPIGPLLAVDHHAEQERYFLVFDGGGLPDRVATLVSLHGPALLSFAEFAFVASRELDRFADPATEARIRAAISAVDSHRGVRLLHDGDPTP